MSNDMLCVVCRSRTATVDLPGTLAKTVCLNCGPYFHSHPLDLFAESKSMAVSGIDLASASIALRWASDRGNQLPGEISANL
jgi:hypothetical protein